MNELRDERYVTTYHDYQIFNNRDDIVMGDMDEFDNDDVMNEMSNYFMDARVRRCQSSDKRNWLVNNLFDSGIRFNLQHENDYVFA